MDTEKPAQAKGFIPKGTYDNPDAPALKQTMAEIHSLGLKNNLLELLVYGYTVVKQVLNTDQVDKARVVIKAHYEGRSGKQIDLENATVEDLAGVQPLNHLLYIDEIFESILIEPKPLALITYLLGRSCKLSSISSLIKGPGGAAFSTHTDNGNGMTEPFSMIAQTATVNYALTPYKKETGALAIVPGSHHYCRRPKGPEVNLDGDNPNPNAIPILASPGDAIIWHGNTWHGSYVRLNPGVRMQIALAFCRRHMAEHENHAIDVTKEMLSRHTNDSRFLCLMGKTQHQPWGFDGPAADLYALTPQGIFD